MLFYGAIIQLPCLKKLLGLHSSRLYLREWSWIIAL